MRTSFALSEHEDNAAGSRHEFGACCESWDMQILRPAMWGVAGAQGFVPSRMVVYAVGMRSVVCVVHSLHPSLSSRHFTTARAVAIGGENAPKSAAVFRSGTRWGQCER
mgnify:CR=1 FL=1